MKGKRLRNSDNIVRYINPSMIDINNNKVYGAAFRLGIIYLS